MSLWQQVQQLPEPYITEVQKYYENSLLPFEVRHCLSEWIESIKWDDIGENDENVAKYYLQELLTAIESKIPEFSNEYFTIRLKLENAKKDLLKLYNNDSFKFIRVVKKCLAMEQTLVECHKGQNTFSPPPSFISDKNSERNKIFIKLKQMTQQTAADVQNLQQIQESFILQYQNYNVSTEKLKELRKEESEHVKAGEQMLAQMKSEISNKCKELNAFRNTLLAKHTETYEALSKLTMEILEKDLTDWLRKQQLHGTTGETEEQIDDIQNWCSQLAELIWENRQQIKKSINMYKQCNSGSTDYMPVNDLITDLLSQLVTRTFIVLKQPNQILKKDSGRFSASVTLLVGKTLNVDKNPPEVTATLISEQEASQLTSKFDVNSNGTTGSILNNTGTMELISDRFMTVTFRNMQLKKVKRTERKTSEAVTEEKFALFFNTNFRVLGEDLNFFVWTVSNPVVVTVHGNQECKAMATILWDNHFAEPLRVRFKVPDEVPWVLCAELLSCKFKNDVGVYLKEQDLQYLATKLFDGTIDDDFSEHCVTWNQFSKENMKKKNFTFWEWFHAIVKLTKEQLLDLYKDNCIAGFIGKQQAQQMLLQKKQGTFLLRFSDNQIGGITIAWLGTNEGSPFVWNLCPYDLNKLKIRSLAQRIHDLNDLLYLYPDSLKTEIFNKYLEKETDKQDKMLAHGYVPTMLKDHIQGVATEQSNPFEACSPNSNFSFDNSMDFTFGNLSPNLDYGADDISLNQLMDTYDSKITLDGSNCRG